MCVHACPGTTHAVPGRLWFLCQFVCKQQDSLARQQQLCCQQLPCGHVTTCVSCRMQPRPCLLLWWFRLLLLPLLQVPGCEQEEGSLGGQGHAQQEVGIQVRGCVVVGRQARARTPCVLRQLSGSLLEACRPSDRPPARGWGCAAAESCASLLASCLPPFPVFAHPTLYSAWLSVSLSAL